MTNELFRAARSGNRGAIGRLLNQHRDALVALASRQLVNSSAAGLSATQLVERTLIAAQDHFGQFTGTCDEEWLEWLGLIMRQNLEHHGPNPPGNAQSMEMASSVEPQHGELRELWRVAMADLPTVQEQVVRLRHFNRWSLLRIAAHLGLDEIVVVKLLRVALRRLVEASQRNEQKDASGA